MCVACACVCTYVCLREHIYLFDSDFILLPIMLITTVSANVTVKLKRERNYISTCAFVPILLFVLYQ